jgi:hypothetical protein
MSICNTTENKRNLSGINLNVILKRNLTGLRLYPIFLGLPLGSVITDVDCTSLYTVQFGTVIPLLFCQCYYFTLEVTSTATFL